MSDLKKIEDDIERNLKCIKHWSENALLITADVTTLACSFCNKYFRNGCFNCPIYNKTGKDSCKNTPYNELVNHEKLRGKPISKESIERDDTSKIFSEYSTKEVLFLSELLNDLIKRRDELREKEKSNLKVGDLVKIKSGIDKKDCGYSWPPYELFPNTIFKIKNIASDDRMYVYGYENKPPLADDFDDDDDGEDNVYTFNPKQFEKVNPIPEVGNLIINTQDDEPAKMKVIEIKTISDKEFCIVQRVRDKEISILKKEYAQVVLLN